MKCGVIVSKAGSTPIPQWRHREFDVTIRRETTTFPN